MNDFLIQIAITKKVQDLYTEVYINLCAVSKQKSRQESRREPLAIGKPIGFDFTPLLERDYNKSQAYAISLEIIENNIEILNECIKYDVDYKKILENCKKKII